uniref:methylmalonate-semialdehyde dehydrogenase (CoA acylating) n=1 Tax=Hyaloperonospora arabidopsidis (strain Emoy2) TaxID=559515 RepID=M4BTS9_HYAAE
MAESLSKKPRVTGPLTALNLLNGAFVPPVEEKYIDVISPSTGQVIGKCALSSDTDVQQAVAKGQEAFAQWRRTTVKARAAIMFKFHTLLKQYQDAIEHRINYGHLFIYFIFHPDELVDLVVLENGKNRTEALASIMKGNETVEYACSLPQVVQGRTLQVSRGITCQEVRDPLGVVACIVPFNFPIMVPMWTIPIALTMGNCVILKPSEKIINGTADPVNSLCDHPGIAAVTFVGSSHVAQLVARRCRALDKRVLALGGAKNHLVALPDADADVASKDIVASYAGCAGQRCMAASVLLLVGDCSKLLDTIVAKSKELIRGTGAGQVGALIDDASKTRVLKYINQAEATGVKVLVDGRSWAQQSTGFWVGPTVLLHTNPKDAAMTDEIFGPVLSVYCVNSFDEALRIENENEYGNAAAIYTSNGAYAEYFQSRFRAGMIGVNIGVPVPREPFSFGGMYGTKSKFGDMDITGDGCVEFFSTRRKITSKWSAGNTSGDAANFSGQL